MIQLVDTHAHIGTDRFDDDRQDTVARAEAAGVSRIVEMGDSMESSAKAVSIANEFNGVYAAVGIHPEELAPFDDKEASQIEEWLSLPKVVAIGEIGLDYYWEKDMDRRQAQQRLFISQLDLARQLHVPVCIHDRDAHGDTFSILKKEGAGITKVVHCYSGSLEMAKELVKLGCYLGFDGPITFKNAAKAPEVLRWMPIDRILLETDCPYMAPVPMRGKRNEPAFVRYVAEHAAKIRGVGLEELANQTTQNAADVYGLGF